MYMLKKRLTKIIRKSFEIIGSDRYSRPSLYEIDKKLEKYLDYRNGFFIEAGANDGYTQSNTYYFEKLRGWQGILIEGIPELYQQCVKERPNSKVFNCALVANDYPEAYVEMRYANLMSIVRGALKSDRGDDKHIQKAIEAHKGVQIKPYNIKVPARTLNSILDECQVSEIDLFSLDVEGFELNVLKGLDLNKYRPKYLLIESRFKTEIEDYLSKWYKEIDQLSRHDFLYKYQEKS